MEEKSAHELEHKLTELLTFFASEMAVGKSCRTDTNNKEQLFSVLDTCKNLFTKDYQIVSIDNFGDNEACDSYPPSIFIAQSYLDLNSIDKDELSSLINNARYARLLRRFVTPVIFFNNGCCVARSSTLCINKELWSQKQFVNANKLNELRDHDCKLLKHLNIKFICDLMVGQVLKLYVQNMFVVLRGIIFVL